MQNGQKKQQKIIKVPDPVFYGRIQFNDDGRQISYTDCWQISMLRFLHLVFGQDGKINEKNLTKYMDLENKNCLNLLDYFKNNPVYHNEEDYYKTEQGWLIRANWGQFLNKCGILDLKKQGKYQVKAMIPNLFRFYKGFFPKLSFDQKEITQMTVENVLSLKLFKQHETILNKIYKELSFNHKIHCQLESQSRRYYSSRLWFETNQKIFIDGKHLLNWTIYEYYVINGFEFKQRQTGHSDYRYQR